MPQARQLDNSTFRQKSALRASVLARIAAPVVMETHGGFGKLFSAVYGDVAQGAVIERDETRVDALIRQRPTWAVYWGDSAAMLRAGAGNHLAVNLLDLDPYGDPWPVIQAFFTSDRPFVPELYLVVNDGLRAKVRQRTAWHTHTLQAVVQRHGNNLFGKYLEVCRELLEEATADAGYHVEGFSGYYAGKLDGMTHYTARLVRG